MVLFAQGGDDHSQELLPGLLGIGVEDFGAKLGTHAHTDAFSQKLK